MGLRFYFFIVIFFCSVQSWALPDDRFQEPTFLVVSVIDERAFTQAHVDALEKYVHQILPNHKFVHISANVASFYLSEEEQGIVRKSLSSQVDKLISDKTVITHLMIMDHGNTYELQNWSRSTFSIMGSFSTTGVSDSFFKIFNKLSGKFSENAFIFLESCKTFCGDISSVQKRASTLTRFFKIENATIFGAHQFMVEQPYHSSYHWKTLKERLLNYQFFKISLIMGLLPILDNGQNGQDVNWIRAAGVLIGSQIVISAGTKLFNYFQKFSMEANMGYLFKFKNYKAESIHELNPYKNKEQIFLKLKPILAKDIYSCSLLFH